jgi:hypothetical protein
VLLQAMVWQISLQRLSLSPPQRLLKNMKFKGIEIALEGIWYEDNRGKSVRRRGEGKEKIAEASARSQLIIFLLTVARFMSISVTN